MRPARLHASLISRAAPAPEWGGRITDGCSHIPQLFLDRLIIAGAQIAERHTDMGQPSSVSYWWASPRPAARHAALVFARRANHHRGAGDWVVPDVHRRPGCTCAAGVGRVIWGGVGAVPALLSWRCCFRLFRRRPSSPGLCWRLPQWHCCAGAAGTGLLRTKGIGLLATAVVMIFWLPAPFGRDCHHGV